MIEVIATVVVDLEVCVECEDVGEPRSADLEQLRMGRGE